LKHLGIFMRSSIVGFALGVVLIALLFWVSSMAFHPTPLQKVEAKAQQITKGFVGLQTIGLWEVACAKAPAMFVPPKPAAAPEAAAHSEAAAHQPAVPGQAGAGDATATPAPTRAAAERDRQPAPKPISMGRCRTTMELGQRNGGGGSALSLSFRLAGDKKLLSAVVRFPPIGRGGEAVLLRLPRGFVKIPVSGCSQAGCLAIVGLNAAVQKGLVSTPEAILVLPPGPRGQRPKARVLLFGLSPALDAMRRAEG
jgi:hypothetical protein